MPYSLSEEQIDFILTDIHRRGIEIEKLQINLLDHICCLIEENMGDGDDFETVYQEIIKRFYENRLNELEKETKSLLKFKYYYIIKNVFYIIFVVSISYNIYAVAELTSRSLDMKTFLEEMRFNKSATLKEGYDVLIEKIKKQYPDTTLKELTCIMFLQDPLFGDYASPEADTLQRGWNKKQNLLNRNFDALAKIYGKQLDFVVAFQRTDKKVDDAISIYKAQTKNIIYLNGMNRLFSGFSNKTNKLIKFYPTIFILNKDAKLIYSGKRGEDIFFLSQFLKTLPPK